VGSFGVTGPYFFQDRHAMTINSGRYVHMLLNFLAPKIRRCGINQQTTWFQQDRTIAHTVRASMAVVREMFPWHVISQHGDLPWPAWSPDLSVCDYFLWGYLKVKVFINRPRTVHELKVATEHEITAMPSRHGKMLNKQLQDEAARMCTKTWHNFQDKMSWQLYT
jgi:hypothetical protein